MALQGWLVALRYLAHRIVSPLDLLTASLPFVVLCCYFKKKGYPADFASAMKEPVPALFKSWNEWFRDRNMHPLFLILLLGYLLMVAEYCAGVMQMVLTMYMFFCLVFSGISMCAVLGKYGLRNFLYGLLALLLTIWAGAALLPPQDTQ